MRFGQRISAFLLNRVLGGHYQKWLRQIERLLANGNLTFLHGFEQRALYLGRRTVYLVGQNEVGKNRTFFHRKFVCFLTVNQRTDDIGRQQVRRKLYATKVGIYQLRKGFDGQRFCQSGNAFEQNMTIRQKADEQRFDQMFLSDNGLIHAHHQRIDKRTTTLDALIQFSDINYLIHINKNIVCSKT